MGEAKTEHWHLKKEVPVALIIALMMQLAGFIWFASSLNSRVENLEAYVVEDKAISASQARTERDRGDRLIRVETLMEGIQRSVSNIERKLDDRVAPPRNE